MNQLSSFIDRIKRQIKHLYFSHHKVFLLVFLFLALFLVNIFSGKLQKPNVPQTTIMDLQMLELNKITPDGGVVLPDKISFFFSDEVDPHVFEHSLTISPTVTGRIVRGKSLNQLDFIPTNPFPKGESYFVNVASGLISKNGKTMLGDQSMNFSTKLKDNLVEFTKDNISGKVLSFGSNEPISLKMRLSENLASAKVHLYRSTQAQLLNYLVYNTKIQTTDNYSYNNIEFAKNYIDHDESAKIESFDTNNHQEKKFDLKPGIYYIEAVAGENAPLGSSFIIVNTLGVTFRQDDQKIVLSTFDIKSGKNLSHQANLAFYKLEDIPQQLSTHTYSGHDGSIPFSIDQKLDVVLGTISGETIFIPVNLPKSLADINSYQNLEKAKQIFVYTDRPLYKPKDTVFFRGIVRTDSDSLYVLPAQGSPVRVWIGYEDKKEVDMTVQTDKNGVFSGYFELPEKMKDTQYLNASTDLLESDSSSDYASTYFDVATYIKPEFEIKTSGEKQEYLRGEKAEFTISANDFAGKPYANQEVTYAFYKQEYFETEKAVYNKNFNITSFGGMCGGGFSIGSEYYGEPIENEKKITLDKNGIAKVSFTFPEKLIGSKKFTLVAKKKDKAGNEIISAANAVFHGANFNIFFMPSSQTYQEGDEIIAPFYAETLTGEKLRNKEFAYRLSDTPYDESTGKSVEKTLKSNTVKTDDSGRGIIQFKLGSAYSEGSKYLVIEGEDEFSNLTEARKYLSIRKKDEVNNEYLQYGTPDQTFLKISSSQNNFKVGDKIKLSVESPSELDVLMSLERGRVYHPSVAHLNKGSNTVEVVVGEDLSPSITIVFSFFANGKYYTEGLSLNTPAMHKELKIGVTPDKNKYKPADTAYVRITTKDAESNPIAAQLSMSIIDKALLALRKNATPPIHSSFYYFRPRSTNASSSLTWVGEFGFGGRGGGGGGGNIGGQAVDTLYWNPNIITDATGETILPVELKGFTTTWKALVFGSSESSHFGQGDAEFIVAK